VIKHKRIHYRHVIVSLELRRGTDYSGVQVALNSVEVHGPEKNNKTNN
jgi:hypothetical protein